MRGGMFCRLFGQEPQGHLANKPRVFGFVDHAHAATAEFLQDPVVRHRLADKALRFAASTYRGQVLGPSLGCNLQRRRSRDPVGTGLQKVLGLLLTSQQCFKLAAQLLVTGASLLEKCGPVPCLAFERGMIKLLDLLPPFSVHRVSRPSSPPGNHR